MVDTPSASRARPVTSSRFSPVIADTDLTCPMFSATSTSTTGTNRPSRVASKAGARKAGAPTQPACEIAEKSTSPRAQAVT